MVTKKPTNFSDEPLVVIKKSLDVSDELFSFTKKPTIVSDQPLSVAKKSTNDSDERLCLTKKSTKVCKKSGKVLW